MRVNPIPEQAQNNFTILDAYTKAQSVLQKSDTPVCSISGGADSDIMMDMMCRLDRDGQMRYVFYNTGLEYQATLRHLDEMEAKYGRKIERIRAVKPVPQAVREYGIPFCSKLASEKIHALQKVNFDFTDRPLDELLEQYPTQTDAIRWWCNAKGQNMRAPNAKKRFNIGNNRFLKEYMIQNPIPFPVSAKCCTWAKKKTAKEAQKGSDLVITGIRKSEGGVRSAAYINCYSYNKQDKVQTYRPLFWFQGPDKDAYDQLFDIKHSDCYEIWGFKRTGCVGCPFSLTHGGWQEMEKTKLYEPKMYKACWAVFGQAYEYTRAYHDFQRREKEKQKAQTTMEGYL